MKTRRHPSSVERSRTDSTLEHALLGLMRRLAAPPSSPNARTEHDDTAPTFARIDAALRDGGAPPRLGPFVLLGRIGEGGMGVVYSAYDSKLERRCAIKLMRAAGDAATTRLLREARAMAQLEHPNVATVYEVGSHGDCVFLVMELVPGQTLRQWAAMKRRSTASILSIYDQAGRGLAAAHAIGVVHRDFKPDNAVYGADHRVRVLDFGLAVDVDGEHGTATSLHGSAEKFAGTPAYMPPEQLMGRDVDARSDQFSFCVALYEALVGVRPFAGSDGAALLGAIADQRVREGPRSRKLPRHVRAALVRGLAHDPAARWPSMDELLAELARDPARKRRRWITAGLVGGLAVGAVAGLEVDRRRGLRACAAEGGAIGEAWNDDVRSSVHAAMSAIGTDHAAETWIRIEPRLDDHARRWAIARERSCVLASVDREWSPELAQRASECFQEGREALRARLALLGEPDAIIVENAVASLGELPRPERCIDAAVLLARPAHPVAERERATELSLALVRNQALHSAGRDARGLARALELAAAAKLLGWPPLEAQALTQVGTFAEGVGDLHTARASLDEAVTIAMLHGTDEVAFDAALQRVRVRGDTDAELEVARWWGWMASTLLERTESPTLVAPVDLRIHRAATHRRLGETAEQERLLSEALTLAERTLDVDDLEVGNVLHALAALRSEQGRHGESLALLERAIELQERALGPASPVVGDTSSALSIELSQLGRTADAVAACQRAVAIQPQTRLRDHALPRPPGDAEQHSSFVWHPPCSVSVLGGH
jgi:eukaryotic-like serine/threonine-protein kinase